MRTFLKGLWIGATLSVPGVSGGTMAMVLGVYESLVQAINVLICKGGKKKEALRFLLIFSVGAFLGFLAISSTILNLLEAAPMPMIFLFSGAIAGGIPLIWREVKKEGLRWFNLWYLIVGILIVLFISYLPEGLFQIGKINGILGFSKQFLGGLIAAFALILPGISVSHMLFVLGIYEGIINAVSTFDVLRLLPFILGVTLGILLFSRMVDFCFLRFRAPSYLLILGFVLGSVVELLSEGGGYEFSFTCIPLFLIGYCLIYLMSKKRTDT